MKTEESWVKKKKKKERLSGRLADLENKKSFAGRSLLLCCARSFLVNRSQVLFLDRLLSRDHLYVISNSLKDHCRNAEAPEAYPTLFSYSYSSLDSSFTRFIQIGPNPTETPGKKSQM